MGNILVIGDALIDTNVVGSCERLSPEGPWPVVKIENETSTLGGAANVAAHISNAGLKCIFAFKMCKQEPQGSKTGEIFYDLLSKYPNITAHPLYFNGAFPVPIKKRILAGTHQICRLDFEDTTPPTKDLTFNWYLSLTKAIKHEGISTIIFSDYNKGTLTDELIQMLSNLATHSKIKTILDPKRPSFANLQRLHIIKPNGKEIPATNMTAEHISMKIKQTALVNTIGADGVKVWIDGMEIAKMPSVATNIVDVCGAGDSFHSVLGIAHHNGLTLLQSVAAGNKASSYAISHRGTYVLTKQEIDECLKFGVKYFKEN